MRFPPGTPSPRIFVAKEAERYEYPGTNLQEDMGLKTPITKESCGWVAASPRRRVLRAPSGRTYLTSRGCRVKEIWFQVAVASSRRGVRSLHYSLPPPLPRPPQRDPPNHPAGIVMAPEGLGSRTSRGNGPSFPNHRRDLLPDRFGDKSIWGLSNKTPEKLDAKSNPVERSWTIGSFVVLVINRRGGITSCPRRDTEV